jgi:DedD protein
LNDKLKQRLVGAVVLISLAVIFVPMLLDGGERSTMPMFGSNIPDKPHYQFEPLEIPLQPVPPITEERPVLIDRPEPTPKPVATPPAVEAKPKTASPATPKVEPKSTTADTDNATAWVVQVGSFSQSSNALALRDKLRSNGFTAFVEKVKAAEGTIYRVRVGPELKRENAEKQLQRLQREMKLKGILMGYEA